VSRLVTALLVLAALGAVAHADTVLELPRTKARVELPDAWKATPTPGVVAVYKDGHGAVLAITRADVPNPDAWREKTRQAYADKVERGIRTAIPGYKRTVKKVVSAGGIPALDVEATRDGGATVIIRVLLFRTYALSLAIEVPAKGDLAGARAIAQSFGARES
jgi:hypothetical protein